MVWFGLLRIYVALAVFQPYRDLEAGDNQSLKIQVARRGIEPRSSCSASQYRFMKDIKSEIYRFKGENVIFFKKIDNF